MPIYDVCLYIYAVTAHKPLFTCGFEGGMFERLGELLVDMLVMDEFVQVCSYVHMFVCSYVVLRVRNHSPFF